MDICRNPYESDRNGVGGQIDESIVTCIQKSIQMGPSDMSSYINEICSYVEDGGQTLFASCINFQELMAQFVEGVKSRRAVLADEHVGYRLGEAIHLAGWNYRSNKSYVPYREFTCLRFTCLLKVSLF